MSILRPKQREALYEKQGYADGLSGLSRPPGASALLKLGLTLVTGGLGAISFLPDQADRDRAAYFRGIERAKEVLKIKSRR